ncbi:MAG TPA: hypothetical protein VK507_03990 [Iamia sp.]|nr:hypothetical protein [Iamia sp.]
MIDLWLAAAVWGTCSLGFGWWATGWSVERVTRPGPLTRLRRGEDEGRWWVRHTAVLRWKDHLPEAGALFGGFAKTHLRSRRSADLARFRAETIRAERVHWLSAATAPIPALWCSPALAVGLAAAIVMGNVPFIVVQRANRGRLDRLLRGRAAQPASRMTTDAV